MMMMMMMMMMMVIATTKQQCHIYERSLKHKIDHCAVVDGTLLPKPAFKLHAWIWRQGMSDCTAWHGMSDSTAWQGMSDGVCQTVWRSAEKALRLYFAWSAKIFFLFFLRASREVKSQNFLRAPREVKSQNFLRASHGVKSQNFLRASREVKSQNFLLSFFFFFIL